MTQTSIERIRPGVHARGAKVALFDFDGTLSLIRSGWMDVMVPMMVELLVEARSGESEARLREVVEGFVWRLTGKETIYQMMAFADALRERGVAPQEPLAYKQLYLERLGQKIRHRLEALRGGHADPETYLVPGSRELLESLRDRGMTLYLASGTDHHFVAEEANLLTLTPYFEGVFGALDDLKSFSKAILIQRVLQSDRFRGEEFLGFGDGYVEIEEVKKVGGVAVGVASQEPECTAIDEWKRTRLIGVGADFIVPNYRERDDLLDALFPA